MATIQPLAALLLQLKQISWENQNTQQTQQQTCEKILKSDVQAVLEMYENENSNANSSVLHGKNDRNTGGSESENLEALCEKNTEHVLRMMNIMLDMGNGPTNNAKKPKNTCKENSIQSKEKMAESIAKAIAKMWNELDATQQASANQILQRAIDQMMDGDQTVEKILAKVPIETACRYCAKFEGRGDMALREVIRLALSENQTQYDAQKQLYALSCIDSNQQWLTDTHINDQLMQTVLNTIAIEARTTLVLTCNTPLPITSGKMATVLTCLSLLQLCLTCLIDEKFTNRLGSDEIFSMRTSIEDVANSLCVFLGDSLKERRLGNILLVYTVARCFVTYCMEDWERWCEPLRMLLVGWFSWRNSANCSDENKHGILLWMLLLPVLAHNTIDKAMGLTLFSAKAHIDLVRVLSGEFDEHFQEHFMQITYIQAIDSLINMYMAIGNSSSFSMNEGNQIENHVRKCCTLIKKRRDMFGVNTSEDMRDAYDDLFVTFKLS